MLLRCSHVVPPGDLDAETASTCSDHSTESMTSSKEVYHRAVRSSSAGLDNVLIDAVLPQLKSAMPVTPMRRGKQKQTFWFKAALLGGLCLLAVLLVLMATRVEGLPSPSGLLLHRNSDLDPVLVSYSYFEKVSTSPQHA